MLVVLINGGCGTVFNSSGRIVRKGGAPMATGPSALLRLHGLYLTPKNCTEENMRKAHLPLTLCTPNQNASQDVPGLVHLREGTKAIAIDRKFLLPGGRLVEPYPASTYDMARDGAIEVVRLKITRPSKVNLAGR
jgi:hypothetical protein